MISEGVLKLPQGGGIKYRLLGTTVLLSSDPVNVEGGVWVTYASRHYHCSLHITEVDQQWVLSPSLSAYIINVQGLGKDSNDKTNKNIVKYLLNAFAGWANENGLAIADAKVAEAYRMVDAAAVVVAAFEQKLKEAQLEYHKAVEHASGMRVWREKCATENKDVPSPLIKEIENK